MEKLYITVKKADPKEESGLEYKSIVSGSSCLHYHADCLLQSIAEEIVLSPKYVVLNNKIPSEESKLRETLDKLIQGHNIALKLGTQGQIKGRKEARRILGI